jgi:MFS superfamily sulfate permease-like transporter
MNTIKPEKKHLASDLTVGLTFALVNIPQAMAQALLANAGKLILAGLSPGSRDQLQAPGCLP